MFAHDKGRHDAAAHAYTYDRGNVRGLLGPCPNGATIIGHRSTWDASGREGGNFEVVVLPSSSGGAKRATLQIR
jgi:hypothetical protein